MLKCSNCGIAQKGQKWDVDVVLLIALYSERDNKLCITPTLKYMVSN